MEITTLREVGITNNDARWLICKGFVEHADELTLPAQDQREFRQNRNLMITSRTCIVLRDPGIQFAKRMFANEGEAVIVAVGPIADDHQSNVDGVLPEDPPFGFSEPKKSRERLVPEWDDDCRECRVGSIPVKVFKLPSPNQEAILMAFEVEGWPPRIDDPLQLTPDAISEGCLRDAITGLNRNQLNPLLRFTTEGDGSGIRWSLIDSDGSATGGKMSTCD